MKKSEILAANYARIIEKMTDLYRSVLDSDRRIQYKAYIWSDGEFEILEDVQGGNSFLKARDSETREFIPICTISAPCFDPWDYTDHSKPENEVDQETEREEIVSWLIDEYPEQAEAILDGIIDDARQEEFFED